MYNGKSILAIIPARGGSKGVPLKNIKPLAGKPLIAWTIEEAKKTQYIDRLILTSDDEQIIRVAKEWGCEVPFVRPTELAKDDTPGIEPVLHALSVLDKQYDYTVLLQPTSPLRLAEDIEECIKICVDQNAESCVSVTEVNHSPYWMYKLDNNRKMLPFIEGGNKYSRRQDAPKAYELNGAVYVVKSTFLLDHKKFVNGETIAYKMRTERSVDIDTAMDFGYCEWLLSVKSDQNHF